MRALLVDDEPLTFIVLKRLLEEKIGGIEVLGTCADPSKAVEMALDLRPDVVFLDVEMPEINGLMIGEQLQVCLPDTRLIFVTAYDQYAIDAFELYAMDYLLKPVNLTRLQHTIERLRKEQRLVHTAMQRRMQEQAPSVVTPLPVIACFGKLRLLQEGADNETPNFKWRTSKSQELFALLLHHRTRFNDRDTLLEQVWPEFDKERATKQLYTTIYHIRSAIKAIGLQQSVSINSGELEVGYRLTLNNISVDTELWEDQLRELPPLDHDSLGQHETIINRYTNGFLSPYDYTWAEHERLRLLRLWLHHTMNVIKFLVQESLLEQAVHYCRLVQLRESDNEEVNWILMQVYGQIGDRASVEEQYVRLGKLLQEKNREIEEQIQRWYRQWQQEDHCKAILMA